MSDGRFYVAQDPGKSEGLRSYGGCLWSWDLLWSDEYGDCVLNGQWIKSWNKTSGVGVLVWKTKEKKNQFESIFSAPLLFAVYPMYSESLDRVLCLEDFSLYSGSDTQPSSALLLRADPGCQVNQLSHNLKGQISMTTSICEVCDLVMKLVPWGKCIQGVWSRDGRCFHCKKKDLVCHVDKSKSAPIFSEPCLQAGHQGITGFNGEWDEFLFLHRC